MARQICVIVENNSIKNKHLHKLKANFKTYGWNRNTKTTKNTLTIQSD